MPFEEPKSPALLVEGLKEKREIPETTLRTIYFQSISSEVLSEELRRGEKIEEVSFTRAVFGLKGLGSKSSGQLMPLGGVVEKSSRGGDSVSGWINRDARKAARRTHTAPVTGYTPMGRRAIVHTVGSTDVSAEKEKRVLFLSARISPFDTMHSLYKKDNYLSFPRLTLPELEEAFSVGYARVGGADRPLMDSLLSEDLLREQRPSSPIQPRSLGKEGDENSIQRIQNGYIGQAKKYEAEKKRDVLSLMVQFGNVVSREDQESILDTILEASGSYEEMETVWHDFVARYLNEEGAGERVVQALECANFLEELLHIRENLEEGTCVSEDVMATMRLFLVIPDPKQITPVYRNLLEDHIFCLERNDFLRSFFEKDQVSMQGDLLGDVYEKDAQKALEQRYDIPEDRYEDFSGDFDEFLASLVKDVFEDLAQKEGIEQRTLFQFEGVSNCDAEVLLEILSGQGKVVDQFRGLGKESLGRLMFEVRRKLYCMATIAKSIPLYEGVRKRGNSPFGKIWESIAKPTKEPGMRTMDFDGNPVSVQLDSRVRKERSSFIRKVLLRGEISTQDMYASSVTLDTKDVGLIQRVTRSVSTRGQERKINDLQIVFNFLEKMREAVSELKPEGTWQFFLDRFEPTPGDGSSGYKGRGPGSSAGVRFGKCVIRLKNPLGEEYVQEVQIFTPALQGSSIIPAKHFRDEKKKDDSGYRKRRLVEGQLRSFAESFFPHWIYQATPRAHQRERS